MRNLFSLLLIVTSLLLISLKGIGQENLEITLNWKDTPAIMGTPPNEVKIPNLENSFVSEEELLFLKVFERNSINANWNFDLLTFQMEETDQITKDFIDNSSMEIKNTPQFSVKNSSKKGTPVAVLSLLPFVKVNGVIQKITSISFNKSINSVYSSKAGTYAASSVLSSGSGDWYKVVVKKDGIYKLDYSFLKSMGIDVDNMNPDDINVYGNSFGRLPQLNSVFRPDDLLKNDVLMKDGGDGSFDKGDYILFYGKGPHKWKEKGGYFERTLNNYSNVSAYFINIDPNGTPARIQNAQTSSQPANQTVTDYNSFTIHEKNQRNIMKSGQRWYGEIFDAHLSQIFSFHIPNLNPSGDARIRSAMGSSKGSSSGNSFKIRYNNSLIGTVAVGSSNQDSFSRGEGVSGSGVFNPTSSNFSLQLEFDRVTPADAGYLDFIEINARSYLKYSNELAFRDLNSVGIGNVSEFQISNFPSNGTVWETTHPTTPRLVNGTESSGTYSFKVATDSLRSFITFQGSNFSKPSYKGRVSHQNLHALGQADYLIVTHFRFLSQASRLANLHRDNGLTVHVVTTQQVYNEFSGGTQDPTAIKTFAKMFYDRAGGDPSKQPKYLLLFGDGTYDPLDRVPNNNYLVPVYETVNSENYTASIVSDDYFGMLDDSDSFSSSDFLDVAVGRLTATTKGDAVNLVNKIELYMKNGSSLYASSDLACAEDGSVSTFGDWRLKYTVIADDEDKAFIEKNPVGSLNPGSLEDVTAYVDTNHAEMNAKKIYSDAYQQITTAGGQRYPDVNDEIERSLEAGALVTCYVGHGGAMGAADERIITVGMIKELTNIDKLTLFVSATCEFARIDDNERLSIGEIMALNKVGGAIALMTTSRAVYITTNSITTGKFFNNVFKRTSNNQPKTFGDIVINTKNQVIGGSNNKRSFMLLGDPALRIALPRKKVVLDSVNNVDVSVESDTIRALSKVRMRGHIEDMSGNTLNSFNGTLQPSIFDKPQKNTTLGQDPASPIIDFYKQESVLFKGKASVKNGIFEFDFIVPKDIDHTFGEGKASFYSSKENQDAGGYSSDFIIGGIDTNGVNDQRGPDIELFLNDDNFVNGGVTDETPILKANLFDESGINTVGNGIGHDITMVLDENTSKAKVLNEFYESDLDTYKSGKLNYQLNELSEGRHTLTFKAWDVNNNSSEKKIEFTVQRKQDIALDHVLNYPNPFTTKTKFFFEHNQVCAALETQVQVYTVTGRLVKTINKTVQTNGYRIEGIPWDGRDDYGDQLARGVYVYRITVENPDGDKAQEMQKIYLLK